MNSRPDIQFDHMMLRIKDPAISLPFYQDVLGMTLTKQSDYPENQFSLYFLRLGNSDFKLELTHNHGTENDDNFNYHNGNDTPQGYGHVCLKVPNLTETVAWFDHQKVTFIKRPEQGSMPDIAFIADPDGYRIEIVECDNPRV